MSFSVSGGRRSSAGADSGSGSGRVQWNGGFGYGVSGSGESFRASEFIENQGMEIDDPSGRHGNTGFRVKPAVFEIAKATINGAGGIQPFQIFGGMDAVDFDRASFRLFSKQPTVLRGGLYLSDYADPKTELIPSTQGYSDWRPRFSKRFDLDSLFRRVVNVWWVPTAPEDLTFEVSIWAMPKWFYPTGALEVTG